MPYYVLLANKRLFIKKNLIMKKYLFYIILITIFWISCKKEKSFDISEGQSNWTKIQYSPNSSLTFIGINDICFVNQKIGFMGGAQIGKREPLGFILKTLDGGLTWSDSNSFGFPGGGSNCAKIFFITPSKGFAGSVSVSPRFITTKDTGNIWKDTGIYSQDDYIKADVIDENHVIVGHMRTIDGGTTWQDLNTPGNTAAYSFCNLNFGLYCTNGGRIAKTNDFGITWETLYDNNSLTFNSIVFTDSMTIVAGGNKIIKSADRGATWVEVSTMSDVTDIKFVNKNIGFAAVSKWDDVNKTHYGSILKTIDGGETWQINYHSDFIGFNALCIIDDKTIIAAGTQSLNNEMDAYIIKTTTQGE